MSALEENKKPPLERWAGNFGDDYTQRNRVAWEKRIPFWRAVIEELSPRSVLELGCNAGWNLLAIREVADPDVDLMGVEPNHSAAAEAEHRHLTVYSLDWMARLRADLVFTAGVLIHVPPEDLPETMRSIVRAAKRYVICIEYYEDTEEEIKYRGDWGLLWKRPFGKLYTDMGLKLVRPPTVLPVQDGFDNCTCWILEKQANPLEEAIYSAA
jgi:pseudaminic acid biosynthesis-associated methylase